MSDPVNIKMKMKVLKDMDKDDQMSMRELVQMGVLLRILPPLEAQQSGSAVQDMRAEFEKQRQFYEDRLKDQEAKIRDMVFEKKIQTIEEKQTDTMSTLSRQLEDLSQRVELVRNIPANASQEQKKDAIAQLEDAGNQLERIRTALSKFGMISPAAPSAAAQGEVYRNPDGTVNKTMYLVDRVTTAIEKGFETIQKKTPERGSFAETPSPQYIERRPPPEEYAETLLNKPPQSLTAQERQWLINYRAFLLQQQEKLKTLPPPAAAQPPEPAPVPAAQPAPAPAPVPTEPRLCRVCGRPEIYQDDLCEQCWNDQNRVPEQPVDEQPKKGMLEKIKEQEEEEIRRAQGL